MRSLAGILARRTIDKYADKINSEMNVVIRSALLALWGTETNTVLLKRLSHILAQSASNGDWKELLPSIIQQHTQSNSTNQTSNQTPADIHKTVALIGLIEIIAEYSPDDIQDNLSVIGSLLVNYMNNSSSKIEVSCARATCACVVVMKDDNARNSFKPAITPILRILSQALARNDEVDATNIIEYLVEIATIQPLFFKSVLEEIIQAMFQISGSVPLDFSTRSVALEFILTICEAAPALARKCNAITQNIIALLYSMLFESQGEINEGVWVKGKYTGI